MDVPMLDLKAQYQSLRDEIRQAIDGVLDSQMCILGPAVRGFEEQIDEMIPPARTLGVSNGTDALLIALMALEVGPGDEVILPPFTFFATAAAVLRVGAKPVFVDIEEQTFNIDPDLIEQAVTPATKAIMPVHLFGQCAAMTPINAVARAHSLHVVEDAAQALGAKQNGTAACALGDIACVSFYPTKNLGAAGEAGLVATANPDLLERCRILRNQGMEPRYEHHYVGGNFRMDAIQGAVLGVKGRHLAEWNAKRAEHASLYDRLLGGASVTTPSTGEGNTHVYHQYTIRSARRDELKSFLADRGVGSDIHYPIPLHLQPCLRDHGDGAGNGAGDFPVAEQAAAEVLSLPIYPELTREKIEYVADSIRRFSGDA
ncbi:MAG: DegT/DnrJ/EryC1/StrS family aminotransferase [Planctomycetes bacterium]|nr:DegT/DnrJ/EryC1/StrS family aminotransferase [Planctomycetota bacterium]